MTDWNVLPWAIDVSHHNGVIDWERVAAQEPACVIIKATERRWTSPTFEANRQACESLGLRWIPYVFLRPDDDGDTIQYFLNLLDAPEMPVALDWEEPEGPGTNPVSAEVVERWIGAMDRLPIAYYGMWPPAAATSMIGECPRWYAQYPRSPTASPRLPMWDGSPNPDWRKVWLMWQWTDKGAVDGITGNVDMNRLACSVQQFDVWYRTGLFDTAPVPSPIPAPEPAGELHPDLRLGSSGRAVAELQRRLTALGYPCGVADGLYGNLTDGAVERFQKARKIWPGTVVLGSTWNEMAQAEREKGR